MAAHVNDDPAKPDGKSALIVYTSFQFSVGFAIFFIGYNFFHIIYSHLNIFSTIFATYTFIYGVTTSIILAVILSFLCQSLDRKHQKLVSAYFRHSMPIAIAGATIFLILFIVIVGRTIISFLFNYGIFIPLYILIVLSAIAAAIAAYQFRSSRRLVYGIVEVGFGILSIMYSTYAIMIDPYLIGRQSSLFNGLGSAFILQFFAGIYIIVRGLVNIEDARDKKKIDFLMVSFHLVYESGRAYRALRSFVARRTKSESQ
jgi:hypothetical protein